MAKLGRKGPSDVSSIRKRIKSPDAVDESVRIVLYGPSGTGKTTIASTFPTPILHLDIKERTAKALRGVKGLETISVRKWEDFEDIYWMLKEDEKYKTVVIDTVSQLQDLAIASVLSRKKKRVRAGKRAGDWGTMSKQDWGTVASDLKTWLMNYRDLDANVVFIAQDRVFKIEEEDEDDDKGESINIITTPEVGPQVMPSVAKVLNAMVDIIGNTFITEEFEKVEVKVGKVLKKRKKRHVHYCLRLGPHAIYRTKFRKPKSVKTQSYITDPTFDKIVAMEKGATRGKEV